jgi:hypothetical protein
MNPAMLPDHRHLRYGILTLVAAWALLCGTPTPRAISHELPDRLDDAAFWSLVTDFSEPGGYFRSDNLVSNETTFQHVIPTLQRQNDPASAYVGVGPDQNFTYVVALKPRIAFIVDVRRQNMLLHLMYKALIEMSPTRAEFLSKLFSRPQPANLAQSMSARALFGAFENVQADAGTFEQNLRDVTRRLTRQHRFALSSDDLRAIDYVYRSFFGAGPDIRYSFGRGPGWLPFPSYRDLMVETDAQGIPRSYLASEENYQTLREMELRNLIVPVVGDFGGPKALRAVGAFLRARNGTVTAFYTSNVEQYLFRGDDWQRFYTNVGTLPVDERSTFIRSFFNNVGIRSFQFQAAPYPPPGPGPRSQTLLNPMLDLLAAYQAGKIQSYRDVIELSHQP